MLIFLIFSLEIYTCNFKVYNCAKLFNINLITIVIYIILKYIFLTNKFKYKIIFDHKENIGKIFKKMWTIKRALLIILIEIFSIFSYKLLIYTIKKSIFKGFFTINYLIQ